MGGGTFYWGRVDFDPCLVNGQWGWGGIYREGVSQRFRQAWNNYSSNTTSRLFQRQRSKNLTSPNKILCSVSGLEDKHMREVDWEQSRINELDLTSTELSEETLRDVLGRMNGFKWLGLGYCEFFTDKVTQNPTRHQRHLLKQRGFIWRLHKHAIRWTPACGEKKPGQPIPNAIPFFDTCWSFSLNPVFSKYDAWITSSFSLQIFEELSRKGKFKNIRAIDISHTVSLSEPIILNFLKKHGSKLQALMIAGKPKLAEQFFLNVIPFMKRIK